MIDKHIKETERQIATDDAVLGIKRQAQPVQQSSDLPELPEPKHRGPCVTGSYFDSYTADQMRDYARKAIAAQTAGAVSISAIEKAWYATGQDIRGGSIVSFIEALDCTAQPTQAIAKQPDDAILSLAQDVPLALNGWKLVPIVPTDAMLSAGARSIINGQENRPGTSWAEESGMAYAVMLAAAPTQGAKQ